jgi:hypothetical protein
VVKNWNGFATTLGGGGAHKGKGMGDWANPVIITHIDDDHWGWRGARIVKGKTLPWDQMAPGRVDIGTQFPLMNALPSGGKLAFECGQPLSRMGGKLARAGTNVCSVEWIQ